MSLKCPISFLPGTAWGAWSLPFWWFGMFWPKNQKNNSPFSAYNLLFSCHDLLCWLHPDDWVCFAGCWSFPTFLLDNFLLLCLSCLGSASFVSCTTPMVFASFPDMTKPNVLLKLIHSAYIPIYLLNTPPILAISSQIFAICDFSPHVCWKNPIFAV